VQEKRDTALSADKGWGVGDSTQLDLNGPNSYDWDVNLCTAGPLNGWLALGLRIWDYEGNVSGPHDARMIYVDAACPGQVYLPLIRR
jgi:hypothetical protein